MEFCPKCSTRLVLRKHDTQEGKIVFICSKCGFTKDAAKQESTVAAPMDRVQQDQVAVIGEEEAKIRTMPTMRSECSKCHNNEVYWWMVQTRGADESPTQFFRCTQCGYTWRESA